MKQQLPARYALGFNEILAIAKCIAHYRKVNLDPGYDGFFEDKYTERFVNYMNEDGYADAVSSGCASIYIALKSLQLPDKSLVATSPVTDASVIGCITEQGHIPYLIDSDPNSYNISLKSLQERFNEDINALVVTHAGGEPCEMPGIMEFCDQSGIEVIEDCSQAVGAVPESGEKRVGSYGRFGCFSTMYRKNLSVSGSSGLLYSSTEEDYNLARQFADRGKQWWNTKKVDMRDPGFADFPALNWNSDELRCAIGCANIKRLEATNKSRRKFLESFLNALDQSNSRLFRPYNYHNGFSPFYFPIFVNSEITNKSVVEISNDLKDLGIGVGVKYGCLVSTWSWAKPFMYDNFESVNALKTRDDCFHLYLNENYGAKEVKFIISNLIKYEQYLLC